MKSPPIIDSVDETCRRRFESAWRAGQDARIDDHLPAPATAQFLATLEELVHIDVEFQWKNWKRRTRQGETTTSKPPAIEAYLDRFPQLKDPPIVKRLVEQEYETRHHQGDSPTLPEYQDRFPGLDLTEFSQHLTSPHLGIAAAESLQKLGPYDIIRKLGAGGMGIVYEAEDPQLKRRVALKVMRPDVATDATARQRFLREAQAAAALHHDHIMPIYQVGEDGGRLFLAMPLLDGETLEERLGNQRAAPIEDTIRIGREIAEGLAAAHAQGLIHRDIKPANIWLESRRQKAGVGGRDPGFPPRAKILDFGLARVQGEEGASPLQANPGVPADTKSLHLTQTQVVLGTPAYMAPEQASGAAVDARADLFSLGAVLYRMTTGRAPFPGLDRSSVLAALQRDQPPTPRMLNPQTPPALSTLIMRLLAKDPAERPASAAAVAVDLQSLAGARRTPRLWLTAGALVVAAMAIVVFVLRPRDNAVDGSGLDTPVAQLDFVPAGAYDSGPSPMALATGDLNGDGKLDLVVVNYGQREPRPFSQGSISVFLGKGDGVFQPATQYAAGTSPNALAIADVNGDGKLDVVAGNNQGHDVSVFLGRGDGAFEPAVQYPACRHPCSIAVADFNGDSKLDLAVADQFRNGGVSILLGKGDGTFGPPTFHATGSVAGAVATADVNGDGRADLVVANFLSGTYSVLLGKGDGKFDAPRHHRLAEPFLLTAADFDVDGKPDLLLRSRSAAKLYMLLGKGDGAFRDGQNFSLPCDWLFAASGDLNNDGNVDVLCVASQGSEGKVQTLLGSGRGRWVKPPEQPLRIAPTGVALGDFNGDGRLDLAFAELLTSKVHIYQNRAAAQRLSVANVNALAGRPCYITVIAQDAAGNTATGYSGTIRLTCDGEQTGLPEQYRFVAADKGTHACHPIVFPKSGQYRVTVTDVADPKLTATGVITVAELSPATRIDFPETIEIDLGKNVTLERMHDVEKLQEIWNWKGGTPFHDIAVSRDSRRAVTGNSRGQVRLWRINDLAAIPGP